MNSVTTSRRLNDRNVGLIDVSPRPIHRVGISFLTSVLSSASTASADDVRTACRQMMCGVLRA